MLLNVNWKLILEMGLKLSEEQLLQMLYQCDKKGQGFISYSAFENVVSDFKENYERQVGSILGLTYEEILEKEQLESSNESLSSISN